MPPGMVSMRCLRSVGLFSSTKAMPACAATSRKRMAGGAAPAAAIAPRNIRQRQRRLFSGRTHLRFTRPLLLLLLVAFHDLLVFLQGSARFFGLPGSAISSRQLVVEAAVVVY